MTVIEKIRKEIEQNRDEWIKGQDAEWHTYDRCLGIIDKYAEQEQTGHWVHKGQGIYCSECGKESGYNPFGASRFSDYCPSCGCRMVEPQESEE